MRPFRVLGMRRALGMCHRTFIGRSLRMRNSRQSPRPARSRWARYRPRRRGDDHEVVFGFAASYSGWMQAYSGPSTNAALIAIDDWNARAASSASRSGRSSPTRRPSVRKAPRPASPSSTTARSPWRWIATTTSARRRAASAERRADLDLPCVRRACSPASRGSASTRSRARSLPPCRAPRSPSGATR